MGKGYTKEESGGIMKIKHQMTIFAILVSLGLLFLSGLTYRLLEELKSAHIQTIPYGVEAPESGPDRKGEAIPDMEEMKARISGVEETLFPVIFGILCLNGCLMFVLSRKVSDSLGRLSDLTGYIASGDFVSQADPVETRDEFGGLYENLLRIKTGLGRILQDVAALGTQVAGSAEELHVTSEQIAAGMKDQNRKEDFIATAIEEMNKTIQNVAHNASESFHAAEKMVEMAEQGNRKTGETIQSMDQVSKILHEVGDMGGSLSRRTQEIGKITKVIHDIVAETRILAFNAAIEAAHAGEQGRGFAVVADEVRKLSERTSKATQEIDRMIQEIQDETGDTVAAMCEGIEDVEQGTLKARESGDALQKIVESVTQVKDMIMQIARSTEEESQTSDEIARNAQDISQVSRETMKGSETSLNACGELSALASELLHRLSVFQVKK
ncbi:MAG: hypothetical protein COW52_07815 [Nitrospirae bacterium CG17_big_fil_post_rev_8_21_14_2_50_50_9]|nr:MAG: hypothetical protein AUK29_03060 [Nitrospirae bacterium CG2_30_53_67]PIV84135.1 MAG: hypothetical protein COW52_07815 [Nitrospirae bacterium CG17_big_fil_post_rev_8_21_14_2_50_50_9]